MSKTTTTDFGAWPVVHFNTFQADGLGPYGYSEDGSVEVAIAGQQKRLSAFRLGDGTVVLHVGIVGWSKTGWGPYEIRVHAYPGSRPTYEHYNRPRPRADVFSIAFGSSSFIRRHKRPAD
jgi:hypothetical protein